MTVGFVLLSHGNYGGAQKRYLNLFFYLMKKEPRYHFFLTQSMLEQIEEVWPEEEHKNIHVIEQSNKAIASKRGFNGNASTMVQSSLKANLKNTLFYKIYFYYKSKKRGKRSFESIDRLVSLHKIDVLMAIYSGVIPLYNYFDKNKSRPKIIYSNMDSWFSHLSPESEKNWFKKYDLFNYAHERCDHIDFLSPFILRGLNERNISVNSNNTITPCSFIDYSKTIVGSKDQFQVTFSARLEQDKNPIMFTEVAIELARKYQDVQFNILGGGRLFANVKQLVENSQLTNVIVFGHHLKPIDILKSSSVFVSIQTQNNYPSQSVLEAMACANAIIATDVGDTRLFMNENLGKLIPLNESSLYDAIESYINDRPDAIQKGLNASEFVKKNHTIEKAASYYEALFRKVVSQ